MDLPSKIRCCKKCDGLNCLDHKTLSSPWYGNTKSRVLFYGSSVGGSGATRVTPFASGSGRILDKIFQQANVKKDDIYLSNVVKCRLPNLRSPKDQELENCRAHVLEEIKLIKPDIIVPMGAIATRVFLPEMKKLEEVVYKEYLFQWIQVIPMYHPAYIMRGIGDKKRYMETMEKLVRYAVKG